MTGFGLTQDIAVVLTVLAWGVFIFQERLSDRALRLLVGVVVALIVFGCTASANIIPEIDICSMAAPWSLIWISNLCWLL